jgi:hypothetical protein
MNKPELKMEKPQYVGEVDYSDLNTFIDQVYGLEPGTFECVADQEWSNDSSYSVRAEGGLVDQYDQRDMDEFKASAGTRGSYMLKILLRDCVNAGLLQPGRYLIKVSW